MVFAQVKWLHFGSRLALAKIALWSETLRENLSVTIYSYIHTIYSYIYIYTWRCFRTFIISFSRTSQRLVVWVLAAVLGLRKGQPR